MYPPKLLTRQRDNVLRQIDRGGTQQARKKPKEIAPCDLDPIVLIVISRYINPPSVAPLFLSRRMPPIVGRSADDAGRPAQTGAPS